MKRQRILIFALLVLLLISSTVASANSDYLNVKVDGELLSVRQVPILRNGELLKTDSPSFIFVDRTLVPVRLVAESYGAEVSWEQKTRTATIVQGNKEVKLTINNDIAKINGKDVKLDKNSIPKLVNYGGKYSVTMVPIDFLSRALGYEASWDGGSKTVNLLDSSEELEIIEEKPKPKPEKKLNQIEEIQLVGDGKQLLVKGNQNFKINKLRLSNPERVVVDVLDANLVGTDYKEYNYNVGVVEKVRVSQFTPDANYSKDDKIVRIVLDMKPGVVNPNVDIKKNGNNLTITPERSFWDNLNYDTNNHRLLIKNKKSTHYEVNYNKDRNRLEISIPKNDVDLITGNRSVSDSLVSSVEVKEVGHNMKVILHLKSPIKHELLSSKNTDEIKLDLVKDGPVEPPKENPVDRPTGSSKGKTIVLDPGHGGKDPGAISGSGIREKDVVLNTSLLVRNKLQSRGYNVLMTRDSDTYPTLTERADFANKNNADIFVSIHANSATATSATGIETYVPRTVSDAKKKEQGRELAKLIQEELIKETNARNRGVKQANHAVTRRSKMPAVLIELGFLSNPVESASLINSQYQDKLANAIVRGIDRYFQMYD